MEVSLVFNLYIGPGPVAGTIVQCLKILREKSGVLANFELKMILSKATRLFSLADTRAMVNNNTYRNTIIRSLTKTEHGFT